MTTTATSPQVTPEAGAFFALLVGEKSPLAYLYGRWQDEKEYENIADYRLPLEPLALKAGVTITKTTKIGEALYLSMSGTLTEIAKVGICGGCLGRGCEICKGTGECL